MDVVRKLRWQCNVHEILVAPPWYYNVHEIRMELRNKLDTLPYFAIRCSVWWSEAGTEKCRGHDTALKNVKGA
eukprot:5287146-Karenia_brevis.AAC.1